MHVELLNYSPRPEVQVARAARLCYYGADIEVFRNAKLTFKGGNGANTGLTVVCGNSIEIGKDVQIGRNVTIRDNNGGHYLNRAGYKDSRPVVIGDKAWLCEGCTIMPGVKVGECEDGNPR